MSGLAVPPAHPRVAELAGHPVQVVGDVSVDAQGVWLGAPLPPRGDAYGAVAPGLAVPGDHGAAAVPVAGVLTVRPGADHARGDAVLAHHVPEQVQDNVGR